MVGRFTALLAAVVAWYIAAPHLPHVGLWAAVAIVAAAVMPGVLLLVYLALPLSVRGWQFLVGGTLVLALLALAFSELGWGLPTNFSKFGAAVFAGWSFLAAFEELSWVVLVAIVVPFVDAISVYRGPTHSITTHHPHIYAQVSIAFLVPHGDAAYLGPPDVLFFALFLAAALRWRLPVGRTWVAMTFMYALTVVVATAAGVNGLPALPFLSVGFVLPNVRRLWAVRPWASASGERPAQY